MANYSVNYNDKRFTQVKNDETKALNNVNNQYNNMINTAQEYYDKQIQSAEDYGKTQQDLQQQRTDFTIEQINQEKAQAQKDYEREQKGAYVDWQQESNQYGANAEQMATQGLNTSGYSESSQVSMYNTYQNRLGSAREVYNKALLNYDNGIKDAQLQNSSKLAEIAYQSLQSSLSLALEGFQYKNSLLAKQMEAQQRISDTYYSRWKDVLSQINTENTLKEQARQFDKEMKYKNAQLAEQKRQANLDYSMKQQQLAESRRQYNNSMSSAKITDNSKVKIKTNYYNGYMTDDQQKAISLYGTYDTKDKNGVNYQPRGVVINGVDYGKLTKEKYTASQWTMNKNITNSSGVKIGNQNVWSTKDKNGSKTYWVWNGSKMTYEQIGKFMPRLEIR